MIDAGVFLQLTQLRGPGSAPAAGAAPGREARETGAAERDKDGDEVKLSPQSGKLFAARVQLDLQQSTVQSLQQLFTSSGTSGGADPMASLRRFQGILQQATKDAHLQPPTSADGVPSFLAKLEDFFTPQNTAQRVVDFALGHYGKGSFTGSDTEALRSKYRDFIMPAIQKGFDQAKAQLGKLPGPTSGEVQQTFSLIQSSLATFVKQGLPQQHAPQGS